MVGSNKIQERGGHKGRMTGKLSKQREDGGARYKTSGME